MPRTSECSAPVSFRLQEDVSNRSGPPYVGAYRASCASAPRCPWEHLEHREPQGALTKLCVAMFWVPGPLMPMMPMMLTPSHSVVEGERRSFGTEGLPLCRGVRGGPRSSAVVHPERVVLVCFSGSRRRERSPARPDRCA